MYVLSDELKKMAESVIHEFPKFTRIEESGTRIAYAESDKRKTANGKVTYGDCQKVNAKMKLLSNYDFLITFYLDAMELPEKQKRILMEHELMHIGIGEEGGFSIIPHDLRDFREIVDKYGIDWIKADEPVTETEEKGERPEENREQ